MSQLTDFLEKKGGDHKGRYITDIWDFDYFNLENNHDFIQWIFPLNRPSSSKRNSPILSLDEIDYLRKSEVAQESLRKSFSVMLDFWGLVDLGNKIVAHENLSPMNFNHFWIRRGNHNQLRMTRVMTSLAMLGQANLAKKLQQGILEIAKTKAINSETIQHWQRALDFLNE